MSDVVIRTLSADDYPAVCALWEAAGLPIRPGGRDTAPAFAAQIASGCQTVIALQQDGALVGVVLVTHDSRKGWINRLAVHPDHRRRGYGRRLIAEAEAVLRAQGIQVIAALIKGHNAASQALFAGAGYAGMDDVLYFSKRERPDG